MAKFPITDDFEKIKHLDDGVFIIVIRHFGSFLLIKLTVSFQKITFSWLPQY